MVKNKDAFRALPIKERAALINKYVSGGVMDLGEMKRHYNSFAPGGPIETDECGYPADITPAIVTQDSEFNKFLMTLPDNQRLTPEEDYHTYQYWKINGRPKDFYEALNLGMYHYDSSDNSYHANSVAFDSKGVGHFMKPKHHSTVKYELDWYNKGVGTLEGGEQYPLQGEERKEWEDFKSQYQLDSTDVDYKYVPRRHYNSFGPGGDTNSEEKTSFWKRLLESGQSARDARVGAVGAQQVRDLYSEGKTEEAKELAKKYAKANTTGIALAGGAATSSLLGDLAVTGATTTADTLIDGDINNFGRNFLFNAAADIVGHGAGKAVDKVAKTIKATKLAKALNSTKLDDANLAHVIGVESKTIPVEARNVALQDAIAFEDALAGLNRTEQIKRFNAFAKKYGYEEIGEGVSDEVLDKATKEMLERHNTFFRGVRPSEEVTNLATKLGISEEEALKIAATTPRAGETHVFVSPTNNAGIYGGAEYVAQVRRPYELGNDRTQWFNEANFEITPGIYSNGNEYFIDPWFSSTSGTTEIPNELLMKKGEFVDWVRGPLEGNGSNNRIFRKYNRALEIYEPEDLVKFANGGRVNRFDIGGDKDPWYKRLYSWIFNDDNTEETTPQENKYLTNDNYLDEVSKFISTFEEFYPNAYEDTHKGKNIWTVGSGLTYLLDDEGNEIRVKKGDTITKEENINQLNKRLQKNIDYVKSKTQYWDNYPAELKFQLLDAIYNIGATKVWNPETNYIKAIRQYENEKGWENPEYDLKNIFQHADWNLNNKGWLGIRSRMRRNPQSINAEDFSKIYQNNYRDSLRTAYDIKFQNN